MFEIGCEEQLLVSADHSCWASGTFKHDLMWRFRIALYQEINHPSALFSSLVISQVQADLCVVWTADLAQEVCEADPGASTEQGRAGQHACDCCLQAFLPTGPLGQQLQG